MPVTLAIPDPMTPWVGGWSTPVPIFSREKIEIIDPYFGQIFMDLRKFWENYRHFFKKAVIFWKNETVLKVCWLGVEKLGIFGLFGGVGGWWRAVPIFTPWGQGLPMWQPLVICTFSTLATWGYKFCHFFPMIFFLILSSCHSLWIVRFLSNDAVSIHVQILVLLVVHVLW